MNDKYLFDKNNGRLLKQWWYCDVCKVNFKRPIEECPRCHTLSTTRKGLKIDIYEPTLIKWFNNSWGRLSPSKTLFMSWEVEIIH